MNRTILMTILFPILVLIQILICNHIMLFNLAVPFIFIYFIIRLPIGMSKNLLFTLSFLLGLCVDIFSDTPGVNSLACVITAALKQPVFYAYTPRDDKTKFIVPSIVTIGWQNYSKFIFSISVIFCLLAFSIEYFSFAEIKDIILMSATSSVLTSVLIYAMDSLVNLDRRSLS